MMMNDCELWNWFFIIYFSMINSLYSSDPTDPTVSSTFPTPNIIIIHKHTTAVVPLLVIKPWYDYEETGAGVNFGHPFFPSSTDIFNEIFLLSWSFSPRDTSSLKTRFKNYYYDVFC